MIAQFFSILFLTILLVFADTQGSPLSFRRNCLIWDQPPVLPPHEAAPGEAPLGSCTAQCCEDAPICDSDSFVEIKPYGFVKWESFFDTRQVIAFREGSALFFPAPRQFDVFHQDINAHGFWNMTTFESRWGALLSGPDWGCYYTDGLIEADFRGSFETGLFNFRLRNVFARLVWETGYVLFGQWWHPLWIPECFPHTLGFGIGSPIDPQARDPQVKVCQRWGRFELTAAALSQADFQSPGPIGLSPVYIEDAVIPNLNLQARVYFQDGLIGICGDYKRLVPRIVSNDNVKVKEHIDSFIVEAFAATEKENWSARAKVYWAQNGADLTLISGYAVKTIDCCTDARTYANTAACGGWFDFSYRFYCCRRMELGCFVGATKNLGSRESLFIDPETRTPIIFALLGVAQNIDYVVEVTPRFIYMRDPLRAGVELQYKRASWGCPNRFAKVENGCPVDDFRILFVLYYMF